MLLLFWTLYKFIHIVSLAFEWKWKGKRRSNEICVCTSTIVKIKVKNVPDDNKVNVNDTGMASFFRCSLRKMMSENGI